MQVLQALAQHQGISLVLAPGIDGSVSLSLASVPWKQAFEAVVNATGLSWEKKGDVLSVWPAGRREAQMQKQKEAQQNKRPPVQRTIFSLSHADASELAQAIKAAGPHLLSENGSITVDARTNRLLVLDSRQALQAIRAWIQEMDSPIGQVELSAHIVTMTRQSLRELGVKWFRNSKTTEEGGRQDRAFGINLPVSQPTSFIGFNIGRVNGRQLELELSALEHQQQLAFIASPRLLAAHRQTASIKQGAEIPYQSVSSDGGNASVQFREAVLGMEVMPTILPQQRVRLKLRISQNSPGQKLKQADGEVLLIDKQEIETQVEIKEGETVALGGIFQQRGHMDEDAVPGIGKIPLLGALFRHNAKSSERRELVVFITPRLIK